MSGMMSRRSYYSNVPGAGNRNQWQVTLPKDPPPSVKPGRSWSFQLTPAFWFGMAMCDTARIRNR